MKIYTKTGDQGDTGLFGGVRVPKNDIRVEAYGALDELNAALGAAVALGPVQDELKKRVFRIQGEVFQLGSELADSEGKYQKLNEEMVHILEKEIDDMEKTLPGLKNFILPGGSSSGASIHLARAICRRCERLLVALSQKMEIRPLTVIYLNRLGDYLFVLARKVNHDAGASETIWKG